MPSCLRLYSSLARALKSLIYILVVVLPLADMMANTTDTDILQHVQNFLMQDNASIVGEMLHHHRNRCLQPDGLMPGQSDNYPDIVVERIHCNQDLQPDSHAPGQLPSQYQPVASQLPSDRSNDYLDAVIEMVHPNQDFQPDSHAPGQVPSQYQPAVPQLPPPSQPDNYLDTVVGMMYCNEDFQPDSHAPGQLPSQYQPAAPQLPPAQSDPFAMQAQLDARSDALPQCPDCGQNFKRAQERDRHLRTFLPHWFFCPFERCPWRGDRVCNLKTHWLTHAGREAPEHNNCKIYNPDPLVQLVASGSLPMEEAQRIALQEVQRRAQELEKVSIWTDSWGRRQRVQH